MKDALGELMRVNARDYWENEQIDFTPWLAQEESIAKLSQAVGMDLEVEQIEAAVGPYSADILARDRADDRYVVVENQFGKTNHDHLGKLITYGSVLDAKAIVWIAEQFTEEHRKALDWLNDHTDGDLSFYGVCLELWQIDTSRPALRFDVVSEPPIISRNAITGGGAALTEATTLQLDFWTQFAQRLEECKVVAKAQSPRPRYWFNVSLGRTGIHLSNIVNTANNRIGVRVYLRGSVAAGAFEQLEQQRQAIEKEIGSELIWKSEQRDKVILVYREAIVADRGKWPEYIDWMVAMTGKFEKSFW